MFNLYFVRSFLMWIASFFLPRKAVLDDYTITEFCWLNDIDYNLHLNNTSFANKLEYGRTDLFLRSGIWSAITKKKASLFIYSFTIRYRREIAPFSKFNVVSKIVGWDNDSYFLEQRLVKNGFVHAVAMAKMKLIRATTKEIFDIMGQSDIKSPELPSEVANWIEYDRVSSERLRTPAPTPARDHKKIN